VLEKCPNLTKTIAIQEEPESMFGKIMSISDDLMWDYHTLLTDYTEEEIENFKKNLHPMDAKKACPLYSRALPW
jgi:tyrosyl-tRNA synthetase